MIRALNPTTMLSLFLHAISSFCSSELASLGQPLGMDWGGGRTFGNGSVGERVGFWAMSLHVARSQSSFPLL